MGQHCITLLNLFSGTECDQKRYLLVLAVSLAIMNFKTWAFRLFLAECDYLNSYT